MLGREDLSGRVSRGLSPRRVAAVAAVSLAFAMACGSIPIVTPEAAEPLIPLPTGLQSVAAFPGEPGTTRPAAPLEPLLAADRPDALVLLEPRQNSLHLRRGGTIRFRFNRPMVGRADVGDALEASPIEFNPRVRGQARWTNRSTLVFTPDESAWPAASVAEARFQLSSALTSLDGSVIEDDGDRLVVFDGTPRLRSRGTESITSGEPLPLYFDATVSPNELSRELFVFEAGGGHRTLPVSLRSRGVEERGFRVDVVPRRPLELGARVHLAMAPRWTGGTSSYPHVVRYSVLPRPRLDGVSCGTRGLRCRYGTTPGEVIDIEREFSLRGSEPLAPPALSSVRVRPSVRGLEIVYDEDQPRRFGIQADWEPDQIYEIRLSNLASRSGVNLDRTPPLAIRSRGLEPAVRVATESTLVAMEASQVPGVRFSAVNAGSATANYVPTPRGQEAFAALFPVRASEEGQGTSIPLAELAPDARPNRWGDGVVTWRDGRQRSSDLATLAFRATPRQRRPRAITLQQTDLGPNVRVTSAGAAVWVTKLSDGTPVSGVSVQVYAVEPGLRAPSSISPVATGQTDANGLAIIRERGLLGQRVAVVVRKGDERAVVLVESGRSLGPGRFSLPSVGGDARVGEPIAHLITDRGAYRPGERLRVRTTLRKLEGAEASPVRGEVTLRLFAPDDPNAIASEEVSLDRFGAGAAEFTIPRTGDLGEYRIEAVLPGERRDRKIGEEIVTVSSFRQPSYRVDVTAPDFAYSGQPMRFDVNANYLFGGRLRGGELQYSLVRHGLAPYPSRLREFAFGSGDHGDNGATLATGVERLTEDGPTVIRIEGESQTGRRARVLFEAAVTDAAGQSVGADRVVTLYPAALEVGVKHVPAWIPHGEALELNAIAIDRNDNAIAGATLRGRFVREGYRTYWDRSGGVVRERREVRREVVHQCSLTSAAEAVRCAHTPRRGGTYILEVEATDDAGRTTLASVRTYVAEAGQVPDRDAPGTAIRVTPRQRSYQVGETAAIAFESPYDAARALVTIDVNGAPQLVAVREITRGATEVEVPITPAMVPSAVVSVAIVRGRVGEPTNDHDLLGPDLRLGATQIRVTPRQQPIDVSVTVAEQGSPGESVPVEVRVTRGGQPARVSLLLWAVDEGSLRLTGYERDDIAYRFSGSGGEFAWDDVRRVLASRVNENALRGGGDGVEGDQSLRTLRPEEEILDPTPLFMPTLVTDENGVARATLQLPERATEYRVMATVIDEGLNAGGAEGTIRTKTDVTIAPVSPRFVTEGDRFDAAMMVHNTGDVPRQVVASVRLGDEVLTRENLQLAPGAAQRVAASVQAPLDVRALELRFAVEGEATAAQTKHLDVVPRAIYRRSHAVGFAPGARAEGEGAGGAAEVALGLPETRRGLLRIEVAPHPLVGVESVMQIAADARYGGLRHHASRVMLLAAGVTTGDAPEEVRRRRLDLALGDLLATIQERRGRPSLNENVRVLHAFVAAEAAGAEVPAEPRASALTALNRVIERPSRARRTPDELAYALRVLVMAGASVDEDKVAALVELRDTLSPFGKASIALALTDEAELRATLMAEIKEAMEENVGSASIRAVAAALELAVAVDPSDAWIGKAVASLLARCDPQRRYGWMSLSDTADAYAALGIYATLLGTEFDAPPTVQIGSRRLEPSATEGGKVRYRVAIEDLGDDASTLRIAGHEGAAAFFSLDAEWAEDVGANVTDGRFAEPRGAITVHRRYETEDGRELSAGDRVQLGEMIRVRLFVYGSGRGRFYLYDPLPGGVEAIQTAQDTTPTEALRAMLGMGPGDDQVGPRGHHAMRSVYNIVDRNFEANGTDIVLRRVGRGLAEYTYAVRATSAGRFVVPPAQIESEEDPSVDGTSAAFVLEVVDGAATEATESTETGGE